MSLDIVRSGLLEGIPHGFFGRTGGVSEGAVASLNSGLGSGDDPAAVETNRRLAADAIIPAANKPKQAIEGLEIVAVNRLVEAVDYLKK